MSLPPFSGAASAPNADLLTPEKPEKTSPGDGKGVAAASMPTLQTKKRKREVLDDMDVGGASSDEETDVSGESAQEDGQSTRPELKRRRVDVAETARLNDAREALGEALKQGDLNALKIALGKNPGCLNHHHPKTNATPLLEALWWGHVELARWLLENGADPNIEGCGIFGWAINDEDSIATLGPLLERVRDLSGYSGHLKDSRICVLSQVALTHAAVHRMADMVELLLAHQADPDNQFHVTPLMGAVVGGSAPIVEMLIGKGANPLLEPMGGQVDGNALSTAIRYGELNLLALMLNALPEAERFEALVGAIKLARTKLTVTVLEGLQHLLPEYFRRLMEIECTPGQHWLLSIALREGLSEVIEWLIAQGAAYVVKDKHDPVVFERNVLNLNCLKYLADGIADPFFRQEFLNRQYYSRLFEDDGSLRIEGAPLSVRLQHPIRGGLIAMGVMPFFVFEGARNTVLADYVFHLAVKRGLVHDVSDFLNQYPNINFHFPGLTGKSPLEIAASNADEQMFSSLMFNLRQTLSPCHGYELDKKCAAVIQDMYRRAVVKHHDQRAMEFLPECLKAYANAYNSESDLLKRIVQSKDARTMEFLLLCGNEQFIRDKVQVKGFSEGLELKPLQALLDQSDLVADPTQALTTLTWRESVTADSLLDELGIQLRKNDDKFSKACVKFGSAFGMVAALSDTIALLGKGLNFQRAAYYGHENSSPAIDQQFANFIGFWLPATEGWHTYLSTKLLNPDKGGLSIELRYALSVKMVAQIRELSAAAARREARWVTELVAELPSMFLGCVTATTGKVDLALLEKKLVQWQVFLPNAQRLAFVMDQAYDAVLAAGGNGLDPAKQFPQFALLFHAEIGKKFAERADREITRCSTSDAALNRARTSPVDANAPQDGTAADADDGSKLLVDVLWWQMNAVLNCFGGMIDGQDENAERTHAAFFQFDQDLREEADLQTGTRVRTDIIESVLFATVDPDARANIFKLLK